MGDNRWLQIEDIFHRTAGLAPEARPAFLSELCAGDDAMRQEVESLLAHDSGHGSTLADAVAAVVETFTLADDISGRLIGPYQVFECIGSGGMGIVYKARDTRLNRIVAIKVATARFSGRFATEARAVAALNHPRICTLYDVGPNYLVMEFVEGENLAARLERGALPLDLALRYGAQIADAIAAAHARGIVHRDLKPANIMLTKTGAKVLDFGAAKIQRQDTTPDHLRAVTAEGTIVGTVQYMSPEQVQGKEIDARGDIFSLGLVLYEMITGKGAFQGDNPSSIAAAILEREAPALEPDDLNRVVQACLVKDPADRFQSARDLQLALEWSVSIHASEPRSSQTGPLVLKRLQPGGLHRWWLAWSIAAVAVLALAPVAFLHLREKSPAPATPMRFQVPVPDDAVGSILAPDGRKLAFAAGDRLWVHSLESGESRSLTDAEPGVPFWSADSRFIGYLSQAKLKKIDVNGGPPETVTELRGNVWGCGAWNQDDVIVFGDRRVGLFRVPGTGGVLVQITALDPARHENSHFCPSFLPDGRHFVYMRASTDLEKSGIYVGSVDSRPEQQNLTPLAAANSQPVYAQSADPNIGYLLFVRSGTLMAQRFDNRRFALSGQAAPLAEQLSESFAGSVYVPFSASANDVLTFPRNRGLSRQFAWYDRDGKSLGTVGEPGIYGSRAISPDGMRLAVSRNLGRADSLSLWLLDLSRSHSSTRFTFGTSIDREPVWAPDGSRIVFGSNRDGPYNLYQKPVNGAKDEELLLKSNQDKHPSSWSQDGRFLLYTSIHAQTKSDIWILPLYGGRKPVPFLATRFNEHHAQFSPDGRWVAYVSDESGQDEVYVRQFSMNSAGTAVEAGGKWLISNGLGTFPQWRGDGRKLYYMSAGGRLLAVDTAANPAFRAGPPAPVGMLGSRSLWNPAPDGRRFLALAPRNVPQQFIVVMNWQAGIKK